MNNNWQRVKLDDVCDLIAGFAFKGKDFGEEFQSKVIKIADIQPPNVKMDSLTGIDVSKYDESKLQKYRVGIGDYVFAMTGATIGKLGRIQEGEAYINQRVLTFRNNLNVCDKDFLYYVLAQPSFLGYILNHIDSETAQPNISASSVGTFEFYLPPISTQKQIANVLRGLDDKIELNNKINQNLDWEDYFRICRRIYELEKENQNLESQAQAIFKSWFVDFEPFKNGKFVDSELGKIPEGWRVGRLENVVKINSGKRPINKRDASDIGFQIPIIGASGIMGYTSDMLLDENILVTGRVGTHGVIQKIDYPCWPSDNTLVIKTTFVNYIYQLLRLVDWHALNRGTTQPLITQADLKNMKILLPDAFQLREYENKIKYFNCLQTKNSIQSRRLSQLRDTLLPKLMSGEIDVSDVAV